MAACLRRNASILAALRLLGACGLLMTDCEDESTNGLLTDAGASCDSSAVSNVFFSVSADLACGSTADVAGVEDDNWCVSVGVTGLAATDGAVASGKVSSSGFWFCVPASSDFSANKVSSCGALEAFARLSASFSSCFSINDVVDLAVFVSDGVSEIS